MNQPYQRRSRERYRGEPRRADGTSLLQTLGGAIYLPVSLLYIEILARMKNFGSELAGTSHYLMLLSAAMGFLLSFFVSLLPGRGRRILTKIVLALLAVWFSFHVSYYGNFHTFFSWQTLGQAKDITQFWREAIVASANVWYMILAFFVPLIILCAIGSFVIPDGQKRSVSLSGTLFVVFVMLYFPAIVSIYKTKSTSGEYSPYYYYTYLQSDLDSTYKYYGIFNTTCVDIKQLIFGAPVEEIELGDPDTEGNPIRTDDGSGDGTDRQGDASVSEKEYGFNIMNIDFDKAAGSTDSKMIKAMDKYFKSVTPSKKNQYTGMFKGKNLIFITLEGFSDKVIDPEFTPVLYRMYTEGFVFSNSYNCAWGGSTASGEYSNITGNFYTTANCLKLSGKKEHPFVMGNQLKAQGYATLGYHNNTYTYYDRDKSHPKFGYKWKAIGNGLKLKSSCWPRSDKEMAEATADEYMGKGTPFHAYYMSVSGHANYSFMGNTMSKRHRSDLPEKYRSYPEEVQAYIACQYEVELMLKVLVEKLTETGELENTVFAMAADHYPYALSDSSLTKLYGLPVKGIRNNFDLYRNRFILWCASMKEPVVTDVPCSTIDILPTLLNLFGLEYDSRIIMGTDILSDGEHFALLKASGWSWISQEGKYRASSGQFVPNEGCTLSGQEKKDYITHMNKIVKAKTTYSLQILNQNYYHHIMKFVSKAPVESEEGHSAGGDKPASGS